MNKDENLPPQGFLAPELFEVDAEDLEMLEERITQMEKYIGIDQIDPDYLYQGLRK